MIDRRRPVLLCSIAGLLFAPSWFLTAVHTSGELVGGPTAGWQAFAFALSQSLDFDEPGGLATRAWMVASALSNAVLVATLVLVPWRPQRVGRTLLVSLAVVTLLDAYWLLQPGRSELRIGYYLWLASFVVTTIAARETIKARVSARLPDHDGR